MGRIRLAIHLHTDYSFDSNFSPEQVVAAAVREQVDCLAITDHDEIEGARHAARLGKVRVIVGCEISSADGHVIGLFLRAPVEAGLSARDTVAAIHDQGGVALAPHPFATLCDGSLGDATRGLVDVLDAVEIHNAQNPLPWQDHRAAGFAQRHGLTPYVGCDTHIRGRLAPAYQTVPRFDGAEDFCAALRQARLHRGRFGARYLAKMGYRHFRDKFGAAATTAGFGRNWERMRQAGAFDGGPGGARAEAG